MTDPQNAANPAQLEAVKGLGHEEFTSLIRSSLGAETTPELWRTVFVHPDVIWRTRDALADAHQGVEGDIATRKAALSAFTGDRALLRSETQAFETWKKGALIYRRLVQRRMSQVKAAIRDLHASRPLQRNIPRNPPAGPQDPSVAHRPRHNLSALFDLAYAAREHQRYCEKEGILPEEHDLKLWRRLTEIEVATATGGLIPLDEWLEEITDRPEFRPRPDM